MNLPDDATTPDQGLSETEAELRLRRDGPNRLPAPQHKSPAAVLRDVVAQPMVLLLVACTVLYALLGEAFDAVALSVSIVVVAGISVYQELRTQRVLEALRDLASPRSTVVRGGVVRRIASQELVVGDRLIVQEGDRLACDAQLLQAHGMRVDESLLSGESVPVDKGPGLDAAGAQLLQAGTLVVQGDGVAQVSATGSRTALGRIGGSLASLSPRPSRLHDELDRLVKGVALAALLTCLVASAVSTWRSGSWTEGLLVGLTLAMAIVPEEYAMVWTVMLALGAWRLAQRRVLTRQPQAIEALGSATVLCVDKTGTLTRNRMEVVALADGACTHERTAGTAVPEGWEALLRVAAQASVREGLEPMDQAIFRLLPAGAAAMEPLPGHTPERTPGTTPEPTLLRRDGVQPGRPFVLQVWREGDGASPHHWVLKGAPEAVLARCDDEPPRLQALAQQAQAWAVRGLRVIAVAQAWSGPAAEDVAGAAEPRCRAVGLLGFADPLRDDVPAALQECRAAGVRVVMITGDSPATALAIARQAGLVDSGDGAGESSAVLTGAQLDALSEPSVEQRLPQVSVFARVTPAQKLRIVQALQRRGEVVAMTGDGVNDGPALRAADVGVAMGERGTDVAREAAALVLMDERFPSLVDAVKAGRRIFANLHRALGYVLAVHVPIVGLSLLPVFGGPVLLLPLHVVLLELIIDPACTLVFEAEPLAPDAMRRPPRRADEPLFSGGSVVQALAAGGVALLGVVALQAWGHLQGWGDAELRLAGLATIVLGNLLLLQWFRRGTRAGAGRNPVFPLLVLAVCGLSALVIGVPGLSSAFGLPTVHALPVWLVLCGAAAWAAGSAWRGRRSQAPVASSMRHQQRNG